MAYKQKGFSALTKAEYRVNKATGIKYKATKSGIPLPGDKTEWGKKTQEEKDAWRKEQTADTPKKGDLGKAVSSAFTSSEDYDGGVMKQTYGTVSPLKKYDSSYKRMKSPFTKETKVEGSKYDKGGVGKVDKAKAKYDADMAAYDKLPTLKKVFKKPPNITTGYSPGVGGKGKASKKILDTFNKIAKNRAKQNKIIQKSLEKKGYIFKDSPMKKATDPVKKPVGPVTPQTRADYMDRQVFNLIQEERGRDKDNQRRPKDDDSKKMTPKQEIEHRAAVLKYNKKSSKPLNATQKKKIKSQLSKMDPKNPEAKLLQDMLNLPKNK